MKKTAIVLLFFSNFVNAEQITVIGCGYVGLITGAGLAQLGHQVIGVDIDKQKIDFLSKGVIPIYEPGLSEVVKEQIKKNNVFFTTDIGNAIQKSEIIIVAVGTPMDSVGNADLTALNAVLETIGGYLNTNKVICIKSTVPIGTNQRIKKIFTMKFPDKQFALVSNPEFLREGSALNDFFERNPIVLGSDTKYALEIMERVYKPLLASGTPIIKTNFESAEMIKYAWNCYSALKITYVNELANLCNAIGADIFTVIKGMSFSEKLLPVSQLRPGPGIGGSCLPKDIRAFKNMAEINNEKISLVEAVIFANKLHKQRIIRMIEDSVGNLSDKRIAILGLSFKANTDDIRYSPAIYIIQELTKKNACVKAYDPQAMNNMQKIIPDILYCNSAYEAVKDSDAIVILTEWDEFKTLDLVWIAELLNEKIIIDTRNIWDSKVLMKLGFKYSMLGC